MASLFKELINISEALANEKGISKETIIKLLEFSFERTLRKKYFGDEKAVVENGEKVYPDSVKTQLKVQIDRKTGEAVAFILTPEGSRKTIEVPTDRLTASSVKQRFMDALRQTQREAIATSFLEKDNYLLKGEIRAIKKGDIIVEVQDAHHSVEGVIPKEERTPGVDYKIGSKVEVFWQNHTDWSDYINNGGAFGISEGEAKFDRRFVFSTRSPEWLSEWLHREIHEISEGEIEVVAVARRAGIRSKVALKSLDNTDNPSLIVRGYKGNRWKFLANILAPEQVDFVNVHDSLPDSIVSAFDGIEIQKVVLDEDKNLIELCVPEKDMPKILGKGGMNISLTAELLGHKIKVYNPEIWDRRQEAEADWLIKQFTKGLNFDEDTAIAFIEEGFTSVEEIAYVPAKEIVESGLGDLDSVKDIQARIQLWLDVKENQLAWTAWNNIGLSAQEILMLQDKGLRTVEDVADLATDELQELVPQWKSDKLNNTIMSAREIAYFSE